MTVRELIERLSQIEDQEVRVMVKGYEGGYNDMVIGNGIDNNTPAIHYMALDVNEEWYYGTHERVDDIGRNCLEEFTVGKAIIL